MRAHFLVAYDIGDPKRLRKVHKTVKDFGFSVQYSVFLCRLTPMDRARLEAELLDVIHRDHDQVLFVNLGRVSNPDEPPPRCTTLGRELSLGPGRMMVF